MKLASFPTWQEAREALSVMKAVYPDDDFFVALVFSRPGIYEGTFEEGGRALRMDSFTNAAEQLCY